MQGKMDSSALVTDCLVITIARRVRPARLRRNQEVCAAPGAVRRNQKGREKASMHDALPRPPDELRDGTITARLSRWQISASPPLPWRHAGRFVLRDRWRLGPARSAHLAGG